MCPKEDTAFIVSATLGGQLRWLPFDTTCGSKTVARAHTRNLLFRVSVIYFRLVSVRNSYGSTEANEMQGSL